MPQLHVLIVAGTRPEAIKMAGLVYRLRAQKAISWKLISSGQHRTMLQDTFADLGIEPHVDLDIMSKAKDLATLTSVAVEALDQVVRAEKPDWVFVQGDTTTAMSAALAAFYNRISIGHVEAGLRTGNRYSPWPEEVNRKIIGTMAARHYAPTTASRDNLLRENVSAADILVTGNTVIDALQEMSDRCRTNDSLRSAVESEFGWLDPSKRLLLVTGHRRENFGTGFEQICIALKRLSERDDIQIVYPVHLNPNVQGPVNAHLGGRPRVHLIEPQRYSRFVYLMTRAHSILTDSGGIQEEAPSLGKPVLVMRDTSERPEAIDAGTAKLVGTDANTMVASVGELLDNPSHYATMSKAANPYGDGLASKRIIEDLLK